MTTAITGLYTYPIKSCGGLRHDTLSLVETGPQHDRQWMVTDADGTFLSQRAYPALARVRPTLTGDTLSITAPGMETISIPVNVSDDVPRWHVTVWQDTVIAADQGGEVAEWFSDYLGTAARLFAMPTSTVRPVDPDYAPPGAQVGFADGYPLLAISQESLDTLNERLAKRGKGAVTMDRFRPNLVVEGGGPFVEDTWTTFSVNDIPFDAVKPCARCKVTTVDQNTGEQPDPKEPLATLATFRAEGGKVLFGQNLIHRARGTLSVGDVIIPL